MAEKPLWKQCADWLCQMEVLPTNHRIMWPDASIQVIIDTINLTVYGTIHVSIDVVNIIII